MKKQATKTGPFLAFNLLITAVILIGITWYSYNQLNILNSAIYSNVTGYQKAQLINTMHKAARERTVTLMQMTGTEDLFERDALSIKMIQAASDFIMARDELESFELTSYEKSLVNKQRFFSNIVGPHQQYAVDLLLAGDPKGKEVVFSKCVPLQDNVLNALTDLKNYNFNNLSAVNGRNEVEFNSTVQGIGSGMAFCIVFVLSLGVVAYRQVTKVEVGLTNEKTNAIKRSMTDALTGLGNRYSFTQEMNFLLGDRDRHSLVFIDLDNFKPINDNLGHDAGDQALKHVADVLRNSVRSNDSVVRLGGDEFAIILKKCVLQDSIVLMEKIRKKLDVIEIKGASEKGIKLSASIGVTQMVATDDDIRVVTKRADEACYKAKEQGKNSVAICDDDFINMTIPSSHYGSEQRIHA